MNPLRDLKKSIVEATHVDSGIVVAVSKTFLTVRTRNGLKSFSIPPNTNLFKPGDTVRFQGNVLLGRSVSVENLPVFMV